jgi:hypothetical protein
LSPSGATGQAALCVFGTPASGTSCAATAQTGLNTTFPGAGTDGLYTLTYSLTDQAGNATAPTVVQYYIDQTAPTVTGGLAIPANITTGSTFSASAADNMDVAGSNGVLRYPITLGALAQVNLVEPSSLSATGTAFDNTLTRAATATVSLSQFYRNLATMTGGTINAGAAPNQIGVRSIDAAGNLSTQDVAAIPAANVSTGVAYTTAQLTGFTIGAAPASLSNGTGTGATSTTLTATVNAPSLTSNTPFTQMCFYVETPAGGTEGGAGLTATSSRTATGDVSLIGCTNTVVTTDAGGARTFTYTMTYDPASSLGTATSINVYAIGSNANTDGLAANAPAAVALVP